VDDVEAVGYEIVSSSKSDIDVLLEPRSATKNVAMCTVRVNVEAFLGKKILKVLHGTELAVRSRRSTILPERSKILYWSRNSERSGALASLRDSLPLDRDDIRVIMSLDQK
jgi:hypothetical protein